MMTYFVGLDVSQKMTAICVVDNAGLGLSRGQCPTPPEQIEAMVRRHAGDDFRIRDQDWRDDAMARAIPVTISFQQEHTGLFEPRL
ncbi:hypothetical protein [Rhodoblastus sp.]|uniref:hypothetical protein n=1 Tax=Rhodoblastus sp. TaxID=1962975 RepID=UPI003F96E3D7